MKSAIKTRAVYNFGNTELAKFTRYKYLVSDPVPASTKGPFLCYFPGKPAKVLEEKASEDALGNRLTWKPFQHYKMVMDQRYQSKGCVECTTYWNTDQLNWRNGFIARRQQAAFGFYLGSGSVGVFDPRVGLSDWSNAVVTDPGFIPKPVKLADLEQMAMRAIMPRIKAELSIINSILELKDFRSLALRIKRVGSQFAKLGLGSVLLSTLSSVSRALKGPVTLRSMSRLAASNYLQWKFAIAPLISDIAATWQAVSNTEKKLRKFLDNAEKVRRGHFSCDFVEEASQTLTKGPQIVPRVETPGYFQVRGIVRDVTVDPSKFHVQVEYSYYYSRLQREHARVLAYCDAFGVNLNPAIIWNAIPFSFLIDWVVGVGRYLDSFKGGFMDPVIIIHRYLWSVTRKRTIRTRICYPEFGGYNTSGRWYELPSCTETAYRREVTMPSQSSWLSTSGLSPVELSLGSALLLSKRGRRKRITL